MTSIILNLVFLFGMIFLFFFLIKKQIRKLNYFREKKTATNIVSVLFSLTLYSILSITLVFYITKVTQIKFDKSTWINKISERHKMIDDLIQSDYLIGKEKDSLENILGKPLKIDIENNIVEYELIGRTWADFRILKLKLHLKNDLVSKVEYSEQK